ncbi:hypothetical protein BDV96DRAFT_645105 [Lophiotrema nucula]|uniref:Uncharacterized protein n=1 Tax=Lophiotrema nucula TaxID=690887 RepID=A0A6A5ZCN4_9PLEO|nr:hypothetical protein BDV96DRAFT_645105 [Lophiotrema nucula]
MFVPRALKLKNAKAARKSATTRAGPLTTPDLVHTGNVQQQASAVPEGSGQSNKPRGPRFATVPITDAYLSQLACGVELFFTDYAHQDNAGSKWLAQRYRTQDGEEDFIHLSAFLDHPNTSTLKPAATIIALQAALSDHCPPTLELSTNRYYVRRKPSTYPLPFVPMNSFQISNDEGLSFWDQRAIYVEPHTRDLCKTPAKVAHWLKEHGQMRDKWLPIQAIHTIRNQCAFVVLSGVTHEDMLKKWRELKKPEDWIVMTKVEHTKRTEEYIALVEGEKAAYKKRKAEEQNRRRNRDSNAKGASHDSTANASPRARQPGLDLNFDAGAAPNTTETQNKKRKRKQNTKQDELGAGNAKCTNPDDQPAASTDCINAPNRAFEDLRLNKKIRFDD